MEKQPAIKSYFFGKGYLDLLNTITDCWRMNLHSAENYIGMTVDCWEYPDGLWCNKLTAVATGFAALSVFVFGTLWFATLSILHVTILLVFFSLVYLSFSFVWGIDKLYRLYHRVFAPCPHCYHHAELPHYLCPRCKTPHTRLIPSAYGILKRRCICGEKLPTAFFNGRGELEAVCGQCKQELSVTQAKPLCIPIVGGAAAGKTCFLLTAVDDLIHTAGPAKGWTVSFPDAAGEQRYRQVSDNFKRGILPDKTPERTPRAFNLLISHGRAAPARVLYLYDAAGEVYQSREVLPRHGFYTYFHGLILLVDPFSIERIRDLYQHKLSRRHTLKPSDDALEDVFDRLLNNLQHNFGLKPDQKINRPLAIVITKTDAFELEKLVGEAAARNWMAKNPELDTLEEANHAVCLRAFESWELTNFLRKLEQRFTCYRFFTCSSLGSQSGRFEPQRVAAPLLWILRQTDQHLR